MQSFTYMRLRTWQLRKQVLQATMASKQPQRSDMTSDLKYVALTTNETMHVWAVLDFF